MLVKKGFLFLFLSIVIAIGPLLRCKIYEVEPMPPLNSLIVEKLEFWDMDSSHESGEKIVYKHPYESKTLVIKFHFPIGGDVSLDLKIVKLI